MKQIILFITLLFVALPLSYASDIIDVQLERENIQIWESLKIQISVEDSGELSWNQDIRIPWIENFRVFSRSEGHSFQSINGQTSSMRELTIDIRPLKAGTFSLGPVELVSASWSLKDDESFEIVVTDLISQNTPSSLRPDSDTKQETSDIKPENIEAEKWEDDTPEGIVWLRKPEFSFVWILLLFSSFAILFYLALLNYMKWSKKENTKNKDIIPEKTVDYKQEYVSFFTKLRADISKLSSQDFFRKYNSALRGLLWKQWYSFAPKATLSELRKLPGINSHDVFHILEKSYNFEFNTEEKSDREKEKFIKDILLYLRK